MLNLLLNHLLISLNQVYITIVTCLPSLPSHRIFIAQQWEHLVVKI